MGYRQSPRMQERLAGNRAAILKAARGLVARGGFREASMAAVAREAGLSTGALYRYFPSQAGLFVELLTGAVDHECAVLQAVIARPGSAGSRLRAAVECFALRALDGPRRAYAFMVEPTDTEVEATRILCKRQFSAVFEGVIRAGVRSGEFPAQQPAVTAACIVGAFTEALVGSIAPRTESLGKTARSRLVKAIAEVCLRAAGSAPGPSRPTQRKAIR
jgi:AcrR family transcriptional regulator